MSAGSDTNVQDALDHVRADTQELLRAVSDSLASRGEAAKGDLETFAQKAKAVTESVKSTMRAQNEAAKRALEGAVPHLEAAQKHVADGLKTSGQHFQTSIQQAVAEVRIPGIADRRSD